MLRPLLDTARHRFVQSGRSAPATDDDLALLGKRRPASSAGSSATGRQATQTDLLDGLPMETRKEALQFGSSLPLEQSMTDVTGVTALPHLDNSTIPSFEETFPNAEPSNDASLFDIGLGQHPADKADWCDNGTLLTGLDFDNFMATFGIAGGEGVWNLGGPSGWSMPAE